PGLELGEIAFGKVAVVAEQLVRDDQVERGVAEELETLVVALRAERGVRERQLEERGIGESVRQLRHVRAASIGRRRSDGTVGGALRAMKQRPADRHVEPMYSALADGDERKPATRGRLLWKLVAAALVLAALIALVAHQAF